MSAVTEIAEACRHVQERTSLSDLVSRSGVKLARCGDEWVGCCPFHADRTPSFTVYKGDRRWHCFGGCGDGDVVDFVRKTYNVRTVDAVRMIDSGALPTISRRRKVSGNFDPAPADNTPQAAGIWRNAVSPVGTPAERYLRLRGITMPLPPSLRFARLPLGYRDPMPCLVALVTGDDGQPRAIHRTYLTEDGRKAALDKPKLSLGPVRGGAIRLAPAAAEVIITEGLEDALTLQQELGGAVWAAAGADMLPRLDLPAEVTSVVIGADDAVKVFWLRRARK